MKNQKGFVVPLLIIIAVGILIGGGFYIKNKKIITQENKTEATVNSTTTVQTETKETTATTAVKATVTTDVDIQAISDIMLKYKTAYESGNVKAAESLFSKATLDLFNNLSGPNTMIKAGSKVSIGAITHSGKNMRVETTEIKSNGSTESAAFLLISENGQWKIDLSATMEAMFKPSTPPKGDVNGYVDLVVTGIKVYPSHPIVNDEDIEIAVTIKNIGTKTSEKGAPAVAEILENTKYTPTQGGSLTPLAAGESVTWKYHPYGQNKIFNRIDVAGKKTVKVVLNGYKDVVEKNYTNNTFTQSIEIFAL